MQATASQLMQDPHLNALMSNSPFDKKDIPKLASTIGNVYQSLKPEERQGLVELQDNLGSMPPEMLDALEQTVLLLTQHRKNYTQIRAEAIRRGVFDEDTLPPKFSASFFAAMLTLIRQAKAKAPTQPQGFAKGGIATLHRSAEQLRQQGRNGDTILAHINPQEAAMLKRAGGSGTINPKTGLPEYTPLGWIGQRAKKVVGGVEKTVSNIVDRFEDIGSSIKKGDWKKALGQATKIILPIVATIALTPFVGPIAAGAITGGVSAIARGGNVADVIKGAVFGGAISGTFAGAAGYFTGGMEGAVSAATSTGAVGGDLLSGNVTSAFNKVTDLFKSGSTVPPANVGDGGGGGGDAVVQPTNNVDLFKSPEYQAGNDFNSKALIDTTKAAAPPPGGISNLIDSATGAVKSAYTGLTENPLTNALGSTADKLGISDVLKSPTEWVKANPVPAVALAGGAGYLLSQGGGDNGNSPSDYESALAAATPSMQTMANKAIPTREQRVATYPYTQFNVKNFLAPTTTPAYVSAKDGGHITDARAGGHLRGPGTGTSDSIPARLSDGEFVWTAKAVRGAGGGNRDKGAKVLYDLMHKYERRA